MSIDWSRYDPGDLYDELITSSGQPRPPAQKLAAYLSSLSLKQLDARRKMAEATLEQMGVTFSVYTGEQNIDRVWPFDIIPRVISAQYWASTARGLVQRLKALNMFINDLYHDQQIIRDGVVPAHLIENSKDYNPACVGVTPPFGVWANICGTDLVRDRDGQFYVLEDNLRVPSGVAYMLENRAVTKRVFPELFKGDRILPVDDYPAKLFDMLASLSPRPDGSPTIVVLTPGIFNSAYFEHAFLAQKMGVELVEGSDLVVGSDDCVYMRTIGGLERVDVIYRRVNDRFLDPEVFNKDSLLGVAGLMRAWRAGNVGLANAPGAGVADDKVVYAYVPEIIKYYLNEAPIIPNVQTWLCDDDEQRAYVLAHLPELVVKPANESGGYGILIGPQASKRELAEFARLIVEHPRNYIAQPTLSLSTAPTLVERTGQPEPRHLDLRPFILQGRDSYVTTGGLTRVAMKKGSLVVNSSQGGGSKDTWIVELPKEDK